MSHLAYCLCTKQIKFRLGAKKLDKLSQFTVKWVWCKLRQNKVLFFSTLFEKRPAIATESLSRFRDGIVFSCFSQLKCVHNDKLQLHFKWVYID